ncbi:MAG: hypothetical protein AB1813_10415 [Verrucomicrobiota bacterium]
MRPLPDMYSLFMKRAHILTTLLLMTLLLPRTTLAQQQQQGVCARVKIEILQELTLERIGFLATLEVTNNDGQEPITEFSAELTFENPELSTAEQRHDASNLFFVRAPELENITAINGDGVIGPTKKAVVRWFIIPKIAAGGTNQVGTFYNVGARLSAKFRGVEIPEDVLLVNPDTIQVRPEPQLEITYFQPRDVQGDDPFTDQVESPIPFTLGVLIRNAGYGLARKVKIDSQQPRIVENKNGLLLIARLLGTRVQDSPLQTANLLVNLGDIPPGEARKGAWDMITSLSGEFIEFKASYTHASDLGGEETSVIKSLNAHFIAHEVLNDQPGRDSILDFLADTDRDGAMLPDALYESNGNILPVNHLANANTEGGGLSFKVNLAADKEGWGYMRLDDPGQARLKIASVVRNDGKVLNKNNYWTNIRYSKPGNIRHNYLNLLDLVELGNYQYTVTYEAGGQDTTPPVTRLQFSGTAVEAGGKFFITPETQLFFISDDESPVSIVYSLDGGQFLPAIPFQVRTPGEHTIEYYATDAANNRETTRSAIVVISDEAPELASMNLDDGPIIAAGDALSIRPSLAELTFQAQPSPTRVDAQIDVFRGVVGFANVSGVPSSPTRQTSATMTVGGDHVDYYKYKLGNGAWSNEAEVGTPIQLSNLSTGPQLVSVLGRSRNGEYPPESNAVQVNWTVNPNAPETMITGTPATPSRNRSAMLNVSGSGVTDYRWTINGGFYRVEAPVATPINLTGLSGNSQVVSVIGKINGTYQEMDNATTVAWRLDPAYGSDLSGLTKVRSVTIENVGGALQRFAWDGKNDAGTVMPPGWYTVRVTLKDALGRGGFATRLVQIGELSGESSVLADISRGGKNPHARGRWVVWQDQSTTYWQIYAQDLSDPNAAPIRLSTGNSNQENPRTDGRYVVWQARQPDGNWDVMFIDLLSQNPAARLASTSGTDEVNPAVDWPWIVWQERSTSNPNEPWQLRAINMSSPQSFLVHPGPQDQLDPAIQAGRVVWQDHRDVGFGEIYLKDLETGEQRRLTVNNFGQYHPAIYDHWVVWQDNRNGTVDIYGYDLLRNAEVRITNTTENEARPFLDGAWVVCEEDSLGVNSSNIRLIHLPSARSVPLTRSHSLKGRPAIAAGRIVWQDTDNNLTSIQAATVPAVQAVFQNQNTVAITQTMVDSQLNAYNLLALWSAQAGVEEITTYTALVPNVVSKTARLQNGQPGGDNFALTAGSFLWVKFDEKRVLDLGLSAGSPVNLASGVNVLSYTRFPSAYSSYRLLEQLGLTNVRAVRMLDSESGRWMVTQVVDSKPVGYDFRIPNVAVLLIDMANPVNQWKPQ